MTIRDPIHGSIEILKEEVPIIGDSFFQRLRSIKQLGFTEYAFPGATHTRYIHSIGVMDIATKAFDKLFSSQSLELHRIKETLRMAALLHDIGHAPLSHTTETVMPKLEGLNLPAHFVQTKIDRKATHEDYTIKAIVESSLTDKFHLVKKKYGVEINQIAELIQGKTSDKDYFTINGINYFHLLHQLISSEMDCDRMDYLLRDSYFCGVSYGKFDLPWILDNLRISIDKNNAYIGISERAIPTFDDFLLGRFHMFLMIYFHYRSVCLEQMLYRYFNSCPNEYTIPSNINEYVHYDDYHLMKVLRNSDNLWAKKIVANDIPTKIFECFGPENYATLTKLEELLKSEDIQYIKCSSLGRISKNYDDQGAQLDEVSIKVEKESFHNNNISSCGIHEATKLFDKFKKTHSVTRIHCEYDILPHTIKQEIDKIIEKKP